MSKNIEEVAERNTRAEKGLILATHSQVRKILPRTTAAQLYKVHSETKDIEYSVIEESCGNVTCDCPDFQRRNATCKHIWAVVFADNMGFTIVGRRKLKPEEEFTV
jgi:uncharacterized Zn finger protein